MQITENKLISPIAKAVARDFMRFLCTQLYSNLYKHYFSHRAAVLVATRICVSKKKAISDLVTLKLGSWNTIKTCFIFSGAQNICV